MTRIGFVALVLVLGAAPARAQAPVAARGNLIVSADRLFGLSGNNVTTQTPAGDVSQSRTDFGLLWGSSTSLYMIPRVGIDYVLLDGGLTLGGSLGLFFSSNEPAAVNGNATSTDPGPKSTRFLVAPRVGWVHGFGGRAGIWLRGGLTYYYDNLSRYRTTRGGVEITNSARSTGLGFDIEPAVTVALADHFGFSAGLAFDLPLTGSYTQETDTNGTTTTASVDQSIRNLAVVMALIGYF
jgi:hypothetical protein